MSALQLRLACIAFLVISSLGCHLSLNGPEDKYPRSGPSTVTKVEVTASPAGGVHVAIDYTRGSDAEATLSCTYPGEDGNSRQYTYVDKHPSESGEDAYRHDAFDFVLKKPGTYQVDCQLGSSTAGASFTIAPPPADNPPAPSNPVTNTVPSDSQPAKLGQFTSGKMWFEFAQATSRGPNFQLLQSCLPGLHIANTAAWTYSDFFKVAADGTLTGECTANATQPDGTQQVTSKLTQGQWTADGQVTFRLETSHVVTLKGGAAYIDLVWSGTGQFTDSTTALGTATWTGTCQTSSYDAASCGKAEWGSYVEDGGTIPWTITFIP